MTWAQNLYEPNLLQPGTLVGILMFFSGRFSAHLSLIYFLALPRRPFKMAVFRFDTPRIKEYMSYLSRLLLAILPTYYRNRQHTLSVRRLGRIRRSTRNCAHLFASARMRRFTYVTRRRLEVRRFRLYGWRSRSLASKTRSR